MSKTQEKEIQNILTQYSFQETNKEDNDLFFSTLYTHVLYMPKLNTYFYVKVELPKNKRSKAKFISVFSRFSNTNVLREINNTIPCNTYSGKCNRFCNNIEEVKCFLSNIVMLEKLHK